MIKTIVMSTFVYALVCIGIVAIKFYFEQKGKSSHSASSGEVLTEVFPMLSELKDETSNKIDEKEIQLEELLKQLQLMFLQDWENLYLVHFLSHLIIILLYLRIARMQ